MRRATRLYQLRRTAEQRITRFRRLVVVLRRSIDQSERIRLASFIAINLQTLWSNFCRAHYLSCMIESRTTSGWTIRVGTPGLSEFDAIGAAIVACGRTPTPAVTGGRWHSKDEPKWHIPATLLLIYSKQKVILRVVPGGPHGMPPDPLASAKAAIGKYQDVLNALRAFRNYFAHRSEGTRWEAGQWAARHGVSALLPPVDALLTPPTGKSRPLLDSWLDDLGNLVEELCL